MEYRPHSKKLSHEGSTSPIRKERICFDSFSEIRIELRQRRKMFLGSSASLRAIVCTDGKICDDRVSELSGFLAARAVALWDEKHDNAEAFFRQFFVLSINAIAGGEVGDETLDDLIQLAETLVRSKEIFVYVMKDLLPSDLVGELFEFTDNYGIGFFSASLEDAVLGAIAIYLGALKDPIVREAGYSDEETST